MEVVRIKGRRRDKGGGRWEKQISRVGGSAPIFKYLWTKIYEQYIINYLIYPILVDTHSFNLYPKGDKKRRKFMKIGLIDSSSTLSILMKKNLIRQYVSFLNLWML
jgi:hypothetical protein